MKIDKKLGSGVAKIHIEDDGSYFQVSQVGSSSGDLKVLSLFRPVTSAVAMRPSTCASPLSRVKITDFVTGQITGSLGDRVRGGPDT